MFITHGQCCANTPREHIQQQNSCCNRRHMYQAMRSLSIYTILQYTARSFCVCVSSDEARVYSNGHVEQPQRDTGRRVAPATWNTSCLGHAMSHESVCIHTQHARNPVLLARPRICAHVTITLNQYSISAVARRVRIAAASAVLCCPCVALSNREVPE